MAKLHHIKRARKPRPDHGIRIGDEYWWIQFRNQPKRFFKTRPSRSQLTMSEWLSMAYAIDDEIQSWTTVDPDSVQQMIASLEEAAQEASEKLENLPEQLQENHVLDEYREKFETWATELSGVDLEGDEQDILEELKSFCPF